MSAEPDLEMDLDERPTSQWQTVGAIRTVLIVVHNVTATTRLLDVLPLIATDQRIQVVFSITGSSAFTDGTEKFLADQGIMPVQWSRLTLLDLDLAISASYGGNLRGLGIPIIIIPHGMGYNKYLETGKQGNKETRKPVFGLSPEWLVEDGELIPAAVVLSHPEQLDRLRAASPEAAEVAVLAGDPCFDRMLASLPLRAAYRRALGVRAGQRLVVVSSTWGGSSLLGLDPDLVPRLAAQLPLDDYRVVLALHPNIWYWHSPWQVRMWLDGCRRAGVRVLPPAEGWRAALVAADLVLGDHGSVTFYGAALGHPVILASAPEDAVDPRSPIGMLLAVAPQLDAGGGLARQVDTVIRDYDRKALRQITKLATSDPGDAAPLLRSAIYRMLDLTEPPAPADARAVPLPPLEPTPVGAQLVDAELHGSAEGGVMVELVRYPAELLRSGRNIPAQAHLVVDTDEPYRRWLELADIIVLPDAADLPAVLAAMPGCLLATAPVTEELSAIGHSADERPWLVRLRDGTGVRLTMGRVDGRLGASIVHIWLTVGRELSSLPERLSVRIGGGVTTISLVLE